LLPSSALSSAQVFKAYPKIAALENRTFHLLFKPDILTCYEQPPDTSRTPHTPALDGAMLRLAISSEAAI
jgi:hypothetical protein